MNSFPKHYPPIQRKRLKKHLLAVPDQDGMIKLMIVYVGREDYDKGADLLIDATVELRNQGTPATFKLIGKSSDHLYERKLRSRIEEENLQKFHLVWFMKRNDLFSLISSAMVSVVPSRWIDNMPNSLIESQSLGIPAVVSDLGSLPELISDGSNGRVFKPADPLDLAKKIQEVMANEKRWNEMHENAMKWAGSYCSPQIHYERLYSMLDGAILRGQQKCG